MRAREQLNLVAGRTDCGDAAGVAAFDAMRGVATHHSENSVLVADSGVVATIARLVADGTLKLRTAAWNLLNILATNVRERASEREREPPEALSDPHLHTLPRKIVPALFRAHGALLPTENSAATRLPGPRG